MKIFFIDKKIHDPELRSSLNCNFYSEIIYKNQNLRDRFKDSLSKKFKYEFCESNNIDSLENEEGIFWCSDIFFKDLVKQRIFLDKASFSVAPFLWGDYQSFVYKGKFSDLDRFENTEVLLTDSLVKVSNFDSFLSVIEDDFETRYFNEIYKVKDSYIKKSTDIKKLKNEFNFFNSVPDQMRKYFVSATSYQESDNIAQYSIPKISYLDISRRYINGRISDEEVDRFFHELKQYMKLSKDLSFSVTGSEFDFIYSKTLERFNQFKETSIFGQIDKLISDQMDLGSLTENYQKLFKMLQKKEKDIISAGSIFSHGDLCLSNILASQNFEHLVLIDPRGGTYEESIRSIYYDFSKLSHSILGNYDKIINNLAEIKFNDDLRIALDFKGDENIYFLERFLSLLNDFELDYNTVRLIEASLFFSMLPLHTDNVKKVSMLAINGCNIMNGIS